MVRDQVKLLKSCFATQGFPQYVTEPYGLGIQKICVNKHRVRWSNKDYRTSKCCFHTGNLQLLKEIMLHDVQLNNTDALIFFNISSLYYDFYIHWIKIA